ncbi:MAG: hypothetical protein Q9223_002541 [Gallowayella weberi]
MSVDGACRGNGYSGSTASAAVVIHKRRRRYKTSSYCLPTYPPPTNQRAELSALILALERASDQYDNLINRPFLQVKIHTDSKYVHGCMTDWRYKWQRNGFINSAGREVANRDLIERALYLEEKVEENGEVEYGWVPREENELADKAANEALDRYGSSSSGSYSSSNW